MRLKLYAWTLVGLLSLAGYFVGALQDASWSVEGPLLAVTLVAVLMLGTGRFA